MLELCYIGNRTLALAVPSGPHDYTKRDCDTWDRPDSYLLDVDVRDDALWMVELREHMLYCCP